jgi:hypothetical protein
MKMRIFAALTVGLLSPAAASAQTLNAEQAATNAMLETFENVCNAAEAGRVTLPSSLEALPAWMSQQGLSVGLPQSMVPFFPAETRIFRDSAIFNRSVGGYYIVLQLRGDGACRSYLMGPPVSRVVITGMLSRAIGASPLRWTASGPARPGPDGVSGQIYDTTAADGQQFSMFAVNGGPPGGPIMAAIGLADRPALRQRQ